MPEFLTLQYIGENILWVVIGAPILFILIALALSIRAPFIAFQLIRRNRSLGRNIYCEVAQADRFMDIWMARSPLLSSPNKQYFRAYVFNGNKAAAQIAQIDAELAKLHLVRRSSTHGGYGGPSAVAAPLKGKYLLRNWTIFLILLFLRMTFLGDKTSHIASGNGIFTEKSLQKMYWLMVALIAALGLLALFLIYHF